MVYSHKNFYLQPHYKTLHAAAHLKQHNPDPNTTPTTCDLNCELANWLLLPWEYSRLVFSAPFSFWDETCTAAYQDGYTIILQQRNFTDQRDSLVNGKAKILTPPTAPTFSIAIIMTNLYGAPPQMCMQSQQWFEACWH